MKIRNPEQMRKLMYRFKKVNTERKILSNKIGIMLLTINYSFTVSKFLCSLFKNVFKFKEINNQMITEEII
jgi:hypothetical protein